jgi:diacylglycerol kinase (ATP)
MMEKKSATGFRRVVNATGFSWRGLRAAWKNEAAFRQEVVLMIVLIPLGIWFGETGVERAMLVLPCFLVLICELANSAIEAVVDRIGPEQHVLSGTAKDIGSAMVFVSIGALIMVWALVLFA